MSVAAGQMVLGDESASFLQHEEETLELTDRNIFEKDQWHVMNTLGTSLGASIIPPDRKDKNDERTSTIVTND